MNKTASAILAAVCTFSASHAIADAGGADYKANLYDADYEIILAQHDIVVGTAAYGTSDADYDAHFTKAVAFNPLRMTYDAGYEAVLAERGFKVGTATYGAYDADYDAILTPANFFGTAALGQFDAGYEVLVNERGIETGAAVFGSYDADYEPVLAPKGDCENCF